MKQLLLSIAVCLTLSANAQFEIVFPDSNARWAVLEWDGFGNLSGTVLYYITNQDTTINSVNYHKLFVSNMSTWFAPPTGYHAAIRTDQLAKKVFIVPEDSLNEYILYDFSKSAGDTIFDVYNEYNFVTPALCDVRIVNADSSLHNGRWLKYFDHQDLTGLGADRWYEISGAFGGLLTNVEPGTVSSSALLGCMSYNDTIYPYFATGDCWSFSSQNEQTQVTASKLITFPNPVQNELTVLVSDYHEAMDYVLTDTNGRVLLSGKITAATSVINTTALPSGFYLLRVNGAVTKLIK